jgi:hypothetical protein
VALLRPTVPVFWAFNPAYAHVQNEHVWQAAWAEIMTDGATLQAAADKAFKRVEKSLQSSRLPGAKAVPMPGSPAVCGNGCHRRTGSPSALNGR